VMDEKFSSLFGIHSNHVISDHMTYIGHMTH